LLDNPGVPAQRARRFANAIRLRGRAGQPATTGPRSGDLTVPTVGTRSARVPITCLALSPHECKVVVTAARAGSRRSADSQPISIATAANPLAVATAQLTPAAVATAPPASAPRVVPTPQARIRPLVLTRLSSGSGVRDW